MNIYENNLEETKKKRKFIFRLETPTLSKQHSYLRKLTKYSIAKLF